MREGVCVGRGIEGGGGIIYNLCRNRSEVDIHTCNRLLAYLCVCIHTTTVRIYRVRAHAYVCPDSPTPLPSYAGLALKHICHII